MAPWAGGDKKVVGPVRDELAFEHGQRRKLVAGRVPAGVALSDDLELISDAGGSANRVVAGAGSCP